MPPHETLLNLTGRFSHLNRKRGPRQKPEDHVFSRYLPQFGQMGPLSACVERLSVVGDPTRIVAPHFAVCSFRWVFF